MTPVSIRDLRNHGGDVVDRVERGETVTVTRAGRPVAELRPVPKAGLTADELLGRCRRLPVVDPAALRRDIDAVIDTSLWWPIVTPGASSIRLRSSRQSGDRCRSTAP